MSPAKPTSRGTQYVVIVRSPTPADIASRVSQAHATANVHPNPATHFEIDPAALIAAHKAERAGGPQVIGYYHSHPSGDPVPSSTDRAQAAHDGKVWAIVAGGPENPQVRFFRDGEERFEPLSYAVLPR